MPALQKIELKFNDSDSGVQAVASAETPTTLNLYKEMMFELIPNSLCVKKYVPIIGDEMDQLFAKYINDLGFDLDVVRISKGKYTIGS